MPDSQTLLHPFLITGPDLYRLDIVNLIHEIRQVITGKAVIDNVANGATIGIEPPPAGSVCDESSSWVALDSKGRKALRSTRIRFSRGTRIGPGGRKVSCTKYDWFEPDEALLHEVVHSMIRSYGVGSFDDPVKGLRRYDTWEDFVAILISNIYTSEKLGGDIKTVYRRLRWDHDVARMEHPAQATTFLNDLSQRDAVERFCLDRNMEAMNEGIADVATAFNPIREMYLAALAAAGG